MAVVSSWLLNEGTGTTVGDSVGANTGTLSDASAWTSTAVEGAYAIDCASLYHVEFANETSFDSTSTRTIAMSLFYHGTQASRAAAFAPDCDWGGFELGIGASLAATGNVGADIGLAGISYQPIVGRAFVPLTWYRVAVVLKNGSAELWVNGVLDASITYGSDVLSATASSGLMSIGHTTYNGSDYFQFNGIIDDVKTYDNSLDATAIVADAGSLYVTPSVSLSASSLSIAENGGTSTVYATLDTAGSLDITASLSFSGTATSGVDYSASSPSITIPAGQTSGSITVTAINDATVEGNESIVIDISSVTNGNENGTQQITITIVDDDVATTLTIAAFCQDEDDMQLFQLNQTSTPITFEMRSSSSGLLVDGLSPTVRLSKNGGAFAASSGSPGAMSIGGYSISISATDFNTLGPLKLLATAANCITTVKDMFVVGYSPTIGLPSIAPGLSGGMLVGSGTGTVVLTTGGVASANVTQWNSTAIATPDTAGYPKVTIKSGTGTGEVSLSSGMVKATDSSGANVATAASIPTLAGIASTVAANVPTNASIASTVSSIITSDHGIGNYATATALATAQSTINTLATTTQLGQSAAALLAASWGSGSTANTSLTRDRVLEAIAGACCAIITGAGTTTNSVKHLNSTAANLTITVDSSGNRSAVTIS